VHGNLMVDVQATNAKLRRRAVRLVREGARVDSHVAEQALRESAWDVKLAIALLRLGVSADAARARLTQADGHLRRLFDEK